MKHSIFSSGAVLTASMALLLSGCTGNDGETSASSGSHSYTTREVTDGTTTFTQVDNPGEGRTLSFAGTDTSALLTEEADGLTYAFKDMNGNGKLDRWEDWRLKPQERAADLAPQLSKEQASGLMLFSPSEYAVSDGLTDPQRAYLSEDNLRLILNSGSNDVTDNVTWANQVQAYVEGLATAEAPYIPVNFSSDPRSDAKGGYSGSATGEISQWPGNLGLAATFDVDTVLQFGQMASQEYRALGITNALSPQIDIASDPRWTRNNGTFGEDSEMTAKMAAAFVEGFQGTFDESGKNLGWGDDSVSAVIKHFAGDSAGEGGRPSYSDSGKYAVFPGDNFNNSLVPFTNALDSAAIMMSYSVQVDGKGNPMFGDGEASAFSKELVDILRVDNSYTGVIMTDWGVTAGGSTDPEASWALPWGVEDLTVEERHFLALKAGVDMFGGNSDKKPILAAYDMWEAGFTKGELEVDAAARWARSSERILDMIFTSGLYENPFLDLDQSLAVVGSADKMKAGFEAQLNSVVLLKNDGAIACDSANAWADKTVYIPRTFDPGVDNIFNDGSYAEGPTVSVEVAEQYFGTVVTDEAKLDDDGRVLSYTAPNLDEVDVVLVGMESPNVGYNFAPDVGFDSEKNEYFPLTLQYRPYTADSAAVRKVSISGDLLPDGTRQNRSYYGKTSRISNEDNLDAFERAVAAVKDSGKDIPVLTMLKARNPIIPAEFEADSDAIAVGFDVSEAALIEVLVGLHEGAGRLPIGFPASMEAVEDSQEDVAFDVKSYTDSAGNVYEYGFGLGCSGPIK